MGDKGWVWKKFLTIAAVAFLVGLSPYLIQAVVTDADSVNLAPLARSSLPRLASAARQYVPHILAIYVTATAALIFLEGRNPDRTILKISRPG